MGAEMDGCRAYRTQVEQLEVGGQCHLFQSETRDIEKSNDER